MKRSILYLSTLLLLASLPYCGYLHARSKFVSCDDTEIPSGMKCIPGGPFLRGSNKPSISEDTRKEIYDEAPEMSVTVSTFLLDETEVTFADYQECLKAKGCTYAHANYRGFSNPAMPMLGANWFQAKAYCEWRGKRLPTEAEWEKAARGEKGELYPWGNEPADCTKAIIQEKTEDTETRGCGTGKTFDVKSRKAYRYGLYDMAGNSWEWVSDWYAKDYKSCGEACSGLDPKGPCNGANRCPGYTERVLKGGSWWWPASFARGANRRAHFPINKPYHHLGFRCAKDAALRD